MFAREPALLFTLDEGVAAALDGAPDNDAGEAAASAFEGEGALAAFEVAGDPGVPSTTVGVLQAGCESGAPSDEANTLSARTPPSAMPPIAPTPPLNTIG